MPEMRGLDLDKLNRQMCCHCLLLEMDNSLALVDTGVSKDFVQNSFRRFLFKTEGNPLRTALSEVNRLGFNPRDVEHIFVTHLDHDHVGGLADFPWANVYLHLKELDFLKRVNESTKFRLRFQSQLWKDSQIKCLGDSGDSWFGFDSVKMPLIFSDHVLAIPLFGHTAGHSGLAIKNEDKWLLHAGDSFYFNDDLNINMSERSVLSEALATFMAVDQKQRISNLDRIRVLNSKHKECRIINSHDPYFLGI